MLCHCAHLTSPPLPLPADVPNTLTAGNANLGFTAITAPTNTKAALIVAGADASSGAISVTTGVTTLRTLNAQATTVTSLTVTGLSTLSGGVQTTTLNATGATNLADVTAASMTGARLASPAWNCCLSFERLLLCGMVSG